MRYFYQARSSFIAAAAFSVVSVAQAGELKFREEIPNVIIAIAMSQSKDDWTDSKLIKLDRRNKLDYFTIKVDNCKTNFKIRTLLAEYIFSDIDVCTVSDVLFTGNLIVIGSQVVRPSQRRSFDTATASGSAPIPTTALAFAPGSAADDKPTLVKVPLPPTRPASAGPGDDSEASEFAKAASGQVSSVFDPRLTEFLFATNRTRPDAKKTTKFGYGRQEWLTLGAARVRVPEDHKVGRIELPDTGYTLFGVKFGGENFDKKKHFQIQNISTLNKERWLELAKAASNSEEALIFVHGFNVEFEEAILRTSQIIFDVQYEGLAVLFSWPSKGGVLDYRYDGESALHARKHFIDLLRLLQSDVQVKKVNILAHSMGNFLVTDALAGQVGRSNPPQVNELIMAAPDVDRDQFLQNVEGVRSLTKGITLYASAADRALVASRTLASAPRAGDLFGGKPVLADGVQSIDATVLGEEMLGLNHSTFAEKRALMNDLRLLLSGIRPPNKRLTEIRAMPENAPNKPEYWRFTD